MNRNINLIRKFPVLILFFLLLIGSLFRFAFAAEYLPRVEISSSPNPVGSGARALGMGGAFIAIADDATAASWNPAALIQLKMPEISFVGAAFHRIENNDFATNPEASGSYDVSKGSINFLSATYPFTLWDRNMIVSLSYQNLFDFTREWDFPLILNLDTLEVNYQQEGELFAYGIAYCVQIIPEVSFGVTLNIWEDGFYKNEWTQKTYLKGASTEEGNIFSYEYQSHERFSFSGLNFNLGVLWNVNHHLTIGAVFKTPFKADVKQESMFNLLLYYPESESFPLSSSPSFEDKELHMPPSYGIGFAYKFYDEFTVSLDIYGTDWGKFIFSNSEGNQTSAISGLAINKSDINLTYQIRIGAEYLFVTSKYAVPLRGGLFYDPAPAEKSSDDYYGFTVGSGIAIGRFLFDIAYQYRFGNDVGTAILQNFNFSQDVKEHTVYSSMIIHF